MRQGEKLIWRGHRRDDDANPTWGNQGEARRGGLGWGGLRRVGVGVGVKRGDAVTVRRREVTGNRANNELQRIELDRKGGGMFYQ